MEIKGKIIEIPVVIKGVTPRGEWQKQLVIIEVGEEYQRKIAMEFWGEDKVAIVAGLRVGMTPTFSFNPQSSEKDGNWYTSLRVWRVGSGAAQAPWTPPVANTTSAPASTPNTNAAPAETDDPLF